MYCPRLPELPDETLDVQSTLLMADDAFLTLGSANLSNRSMTFDSECNLAIASGRNERASRAIAALRNRLLGEHLGTEPARMETEFARQSSLLRAIEALCDSGRTLSPIEPLVTADSDRSIPREASEDPERPMDPQKLLAEFVPGESKRPPARHIARIAAFVVVLGGLAAAWRWTPLHEWLNVDRLVQMAAGFDRAPYAPLAVIVAYVAAGFVVMPITVLIAATGIVFGPFMGAVYALVGAVVSAGVMYAIGRRLGRETVRRVAGARLNRLSRQLARRGVLAIALLRMLPLAPFTVVNIVAGASYIGVRDFLLGTVIGLTPGILATVVFVDRIVEAVRNPSAITFVSLAAVIVAVTALAVVARRRFGGSQHGTS
jgi:uncharacterized membrane protein YdjX (TVP38/TMEM64 family)